MLTRLIYPLSLREKISFRLQRLYTSINDKGIPLEFNKNIKLDLSKNDVGHKSIIFNGFYELDLTKTLIELGNNGGTLLDVGANYGYFSCLWAAQNCQNRAFAFEASPVNIDHLKNNVTVNKLYDRIKVIPIAMGKEQGKLQFDLHTENKQTGWGGFTMNLNLASVEVEVDTLDNYCQLNNINQIKVLKIDTEGADTWVLYGAKQLIKRKRIKHIFFEHNPVRMKLLNIGKDEAREFLQSLDYVVESLSPTDFYAYPK